ncbi:hypothetical protein JM18_002558 [Phytophthora kernoviae]|uniref:Uncharacterized protein n=2 Tax=Phytophthora kernoviae TaxID=325452 RepID=A0A921VC99_9STRA|nr:hypothetical protein G195_003473 [Phytophthora kernoviae 00238/432]KAG2529048.1 hypothetical protein JM18_002558 [Phytophthora kernoviae]
MMTICSATMTKRTTRLPRRSLPSVRRLPRPPRRWCWRSSRGRPRPTSRSWLPRSRPCPLRV